MDGCVWSWGHLPTNLCSFSSRENEESKSWGTPISHNSCDVVVFFSELQYGWLHEKPQLIDWLVVWFTFAIVFPKLAGMMIQSDVHIFQRDGSTTTTKQCPGQMLQHGALELWNLASPCAKGCGAVEANWKDMLYPVMTNVANWKDPPIFNRLVIIKPSITGPFSIAMLNCRVG